MRERIVPVGEREVGLAKVKPMGGEAESRFEELVVAELKGVMGLGCTRCRETEGGRRGTIFVRW